MENLNRLLTYLALGLIGGIIFRMKFYGLELSEIISANPLKSGVNLFFIAGSLGMWWFFHVKPDGSVDASSMKVDDKEAKLRFDRMVNTKSEGKPTWSDDKRRKKSHYAYDDKGNGFFAEKSKKKK